MNIRENLINSTQPALVVKAFLFFIIILLLYAVVSWIQLDEYDTDSTYSILVLRAIANSICEIDHPNRDQWSEITNKAAYDLCKDNFCKRKNIKITDKAAFGLCKDKQIQKLNSERDRERAAVFVKVKAAGFIPYLLKNKYEKLVGIAVYTAMLYFVMLTYVLYAKCNNLGWKRLSIIFALVAGFLGGVGIINGIGDLEGVGTNISGEEFVQISFGALAGFILAIFILHGGRKLVVWIKEGFNPPQ